MEAFHFPFLLSAGVIGFKEALSGAHSGKNLGRYTIRLLHRVGIIDTKRSIACAWRAVSLVHEAQFTQHNRIQ
jgi:hypothetical protein